MTEEARCPHCGRIVTISKGRGVMQRQSFRKHYKDGSYADNDLACEKELCPGSWCDVLPEDFIENKKEYRA